MAALPGGGLPVAGARWPHNLAEVTPDDRVAELYGGAGAEAYFNTREPRRLPSPPPARPSIPGGPALHPPGQRATKPVEDEEPDRRAPGALSAESRRAEQLGYTSPAEPTAFADLPIEQVMAKLVSPDPEIAAEARAELIERGFRPLELELTARLYSPSAAVREDLAATLPRLSSIDPAPWLLHLARDQDPQVRWTAIATLATGRDPSVLAELEQIVRSDPDPQLRQRAERLFSTAAARPR
jgi:hypothetical protein